MKINAFDRELSEEEISRGDHRVLVGGMWEEIGRLQLDYLKGRGLKPSMRLLDIGCGALRGGVHFIRYLEKGNYHGVDANASLLKAGLEIELRREGLEDRLPAGNLMAEGAFDFSGFGTTFQMALALSLFTHLPINQIYLCLLRLAEVMVPGGAFYATFFECPPDRKLDAPVTHRPGGVTSYFYQDPYHYKVSHLQMLLGDLPWRLHSVGEWGHPRAQRMLCFIRL